LNAIVERAGSILKISLATAEGLEIAKHKPTARSKPESFTGKVAAGVHALASGQW
jgi:hypothetical protein